MVNQILITGDFHIRATTPAMRIEKDWWEDILRPKIKFICEYAKKHNLVIYHTGDMFDSSYFNSLRILNDLKSLLDGVDITAIFGNHDVYHRSFDSLNRTPFKNLGLKLPESFVTHEVKEQLEDSEFLFIHRFVVKEFCPKYIEQCLTVEELFSLYPQYKFYVIGDNHSGWYYKSKGKIAINPGSISRNTIKQRDYKPRFYVLDLDTLDIKTVYIPINKNVFKDANSIDALEFNCRNIINSFKDSEDLTALEFKDIINLAIKDAPTEIKNKVNYYIEKGGN